MFNLIDNVKLGIGNGSGKGKLTETNPRPPTNDKKEDLHEKIRRRLQRGEELRKFLKEDEFSLPKKDEQNKKDK